jgi:hypothetical protein
VEGVLLAVLTKSSTLVDSLDAYPRWLVAAGATVAVAVAIWLVAKLLKWTLLVLLFVVLVGGLGVTAWLLLRN